MFGKLNAFKGAGGPPHPVETSSQGEADEILNKAIQAGDRGATLSSVERAILDKHYPDIFKQEKTDPVYAPYDDRKAA